MFYYKSNFDFSAKTKQSLLDYFSIKFKTNFPHAEAIEEEHPYKKFLWVKTAAGQELEVFLKKFNCDLNHDGITFFISNTINYYIGNPHIDSIPDSKTSDSDAYLHTDGSRIKSRFSVMVLGNPQDPMYWWDSIPFGDPRLVVNEFKYLNNERYYSLNIPGSNTEERWNYLGQPTIVADNVWTPSAFIKTDCAHTVNCSPGPRLMVTVALEKSVEEIMS
jgi:hypothetical protein